jgi:hypothetical protein
MKSLLTQFLNYNSEILDKADDSSASHYQNQVWLRAVVPARPAATEIGWLGGNPRLPDPFQWPGRDGQPYQFLCQIDCASLPPGLWGGIGPRTGWLAFFTAVSGRVDVKVIYAPKLGPERRNDDAWRKSSTGLYWVDDKHDALLAPPPRWALEFVHPIDGENCVPNRLRQRPSADDAVAIASPEHQPIDWRTLEVLVHEAISESRKRAAGWADAARQQEARLKPPRKELVTALEKMIETADQLHGALEASEATRPFSLQGWLAHAELIFRIRALDDEVALQQGASLLAAPGRYEIESANRRGVLPPLFAPDTDQGRRHAELMRLIEELERDLEADRRVPPRPKGAFFTPDYASWLEYREKFPQDWEAYAGRVRHIRRLYYSFWVDNAATIAPTMKNGPVSAPPDTWAEALGRADSQREWAHEQLRKFETANPEEVERLAGSRRKREKAETLVAELETVMRKIRDRRPEAAFVPDEWTALYRLLDAHEADQVLSKYWSAGYGVLRSEVAKQLCAGNPDALSPAVRRCLEAEWAFDAEQATLQIGGTPRGWCADFIENKPKSVMLLQFPTNHLTHFRCGDVSDLVVSISRSDLVRRNFTNVRVDVSN